VHPFGVLERFGVIILNSGGTFNKRYDPIMGELVVPKDNRAIEEILGAVQMPLPVRGLIYKDSLEFDEKDRAALVDAIEASRANSVVIVHGTDTMDASAAYVAKRIQDRCIVFTGAMVPYSIDKAEASANLMLAIAKALHFPSNGVFIAMHGIVEEHTKIYKDRKRGVFCRK